MKKETVPQIPNIQISKIHSTQVFTKLKQSDKDEKFRHKIVPIEGDCSLPGLGMSDSDRQKLVENCQIIIHAAATVRFDEKLKLAIAINVCGTREIMLLSKQLKSLVVCTNMNQINLIIMHANCVF